MQYLNLDEDVLKKGGQSIQPKKYLDNPSCGRVFLIKSYWSRSHYALFGLWSLKRLKKLFLRGQAQVLTSRFRCPQPIWCHIQKTIFKGIIFNKVWCRLWVPCRKCMISAQPYYEVRPGSIAMTLGWKRGNDGTTFIK